MTELVYSFGHLTLFLFLEVRKTQSVSMHYPYSGQTFNFMAGILIVHSHTFGFSQLTLSVFIVVVQEVDRTF